MDYLTLHFPASGHFNQSTSPIRRKRAASHFPYCFYQQDELCRYFSLAFMTVQDVTAIKLL